MPYKPRSACPRRGSLYRAHRRQMAWADRRQTSAAARGYGLPWQRIRRVPLKSEPECAASPLAATLRRVGGWVHLQRRGPIGLPYRAVRRYDRAR